MGYVKFTEEERNRARETNLADFLEEHGETVKKSGSEFVWLDGEQKVTLRGNLFFHQYEQKGGDAIDFVRKFYGKNYVEAVQMLLGSNADIQPIAKKEHYEHQPKDLKMPPKNDSMKRVFAYLLMTRGIDKSVLQEFVRQNMIYESADYHNAVFVGYDENGTPRHANMRGTGTQNPFKCNAVGSQPEYSFHWNGTSSYLFLFEAPIDMMSFISMHSHQNWKQHSYAAACSVSDKVLFECLKNNLQIKNVYLCLDNDQAGQSANQRIYEKLSQTDINAKILVPHNKDWNEDLLMRNNGGETQCQAVRS